MVEQILLSSGSFDGVRETQIRAVLASELEPDAAWLLAEPVVDRANNRIDWYTQGNPDCQPEALSELAEEQRRPILARVDDLLDRGRELAERYAGSGDPRRVQLGAILKAVLDAPAETEVFLVEGRPVITRWGFSPDRPWEMPGGPVGGPVVPPPVPAQSPRDVVVPQITTPELATAVPESAPPAEAPPTLELATEPPAKTPEPEPATLEPSPEPAPAPVATGSSPALDSSPLTPHPSRRDSSPAPLESELASPLRYVVVGSRYFWGVVTLAILLAVAAVWVGMGKSLPNPATGKMTRSPASDAELDRALTEAQRVEAELQAQFEKLLVQLAERRGQCSLPASDSAAAGSARSQPPGVVPGDKAGSGLGVGTNRPSHHNHRSNRRSGPNPLSGPNRRSGPNHRSEPNRRSRLSRLPRSGGNSPAACRPLARRLARSPRPCCGTVMATSIWWCAARPAGNWTTAIRLNAAVPWMWTRTLPVPM